MVRLDRERKGKTPVDVTITEQNGNVRVRLTMGDDYASKKNTDMTVQETRDLATLLTYHAEVADGNL